MIIVMVESHTIPCDNCKGRGITPDALATQFPCPKCAGTGIA